MKEEKKKKEERHESKEELRREASGRNSKRLEGKLVASVACGGM